MPKPRASSKRAGKLGGKRRMPAMPKVMGGLNPPMMPPPVPMQPPAPPGMKEDTNATPPHDKI